MFLSREEEEEMLECDFCGKEYNPVATRWKCNHCGNKTSCCEGEACDPVIPATTPAPSVEDLGKCEECCCGEACGECHKDCNDPECTYGED
jgi:hypothetical protein